MENYEQMCKHIIDYVNREHKRQFELMISKPDSKYRIQVVENGKVYGNVFLSFSDLFEALKLFADMRYSLLKK